LDSNNQAEVDDMVSLLKKGSLNKNLDMDTTERTLISFEILTTKTLQKPNSL